MDEEEFKRLKASVTAIGCPFEKSIQQRRCDCVQASRFNIGERESISCSRREAADRCRAFLEALREKSGFALGRRGVPAILPYAKSMQVQLGGLAGLAEALENGTDGGRRGGGFSSPGPGGALRDISALLDAAEARYGGVEGLPYSEIMRVLVHTRVRRRHGR